MVRSVLIELTIQGDGCSGVRYGTMFVVGRDDEGDGSYGAVQWEKTEKEPRFSIGRVRRDPQLGGSSHTILHGFL